GWRCGRGLRGEDGSGTEFEDMAAARAVDRRDPLDLRLWEDVGAGWIRTGKALCHVCGPSRGVGPGGAVALARISQALRFSYSRGSQNRGSANRGETNRPRPMNFL